MLGWHGTVMQVRSCCSIHQQCVIDRKGMLIAERGLAHTTGVSDAHRSSAIGDRKHLQPGALSKQPRGRDLSGGRVHARVRYLTQPPRDGGVGRMLVGCEPELAHRGDERHPETALEITNEPLDFSLVRARYGWHSRGMKPACLA
jgi:hypothetical protein